MKHFFIINPAAGQGRAVDLEEEIRIQAELRGLLVTSDQKHAVNDPGDHDVIIYRTKGIGDAERYVKFICRTLLGTDPDWTINGYVQRTGDEKFRFYACGGDGTLNEVVNGCYGYDGAEVACIPCGTGNDYIACYEDAGDFMSISAQMDGKAVKSDLIRYANEEGVRYCINMFNIGLDCNVVDLTQKMKKVPLVQGSMAYYLSLLVTFVRKKGTDLTIECDGETIWDDKLLLVAIANGKFCGGGVKAIPQADLNDGLMDISIVKKASRLQFAKLFSEYKKGTHLADEKARELFVVEKCERTVITPRKEKMKISVDGEIREVGRTVFDIVPNGILFSVPAAK